MKTIMTSLLMQAALFTVTSVYSAEEVTRVHAFNVADIREVEIRASVGEMEIVLVDGDEMRLTLEIEGEDGGWLRRAKDVSNVDLESRVSGGRLVLSMEEDDTNTHWTIQLPALDATRIAMGVGRIDAEVGATDLDVNLGVGETVIRAPLASTGDIDLSVGVGEARVTGTPELQSERAFVSQNVHAQGEGEYRLVVHIGVGEARVGLD